VIERTARLLPHSMRMRMTMAAEPITFLIAVECAPVMGRLSRRVAPGRRAPFAPSLELGYRRTR
jgi:hypothetical protein